MQPKSSKRIFAHIIYWITFIFSYPLFYSALAIGSLEYYANQSLSLALGSFYLIPAAYFITYFLIPKLLIKQKKYLLFLISYFAIFVLLTFIDILFARYHYIPKYNPNYTDLFFISAFKIKYLAKVFFIIHSEIFIFIAFRFFIQYLKNYFEKETLKHKIVETELNMLKGQIHPHFLFNTLNNIYTMSLDCNNHELSESIAKMSDILRFTLYECNSLLIPIEKELKIIYDYIYLEKLRYSNIKIDITTPKKFNSAYIIPLILFPFIENAFKHGTSKTVKNKWLKIILFVENDILHFNVKNSKKPDEAYTKKNYNYSKGIGINNATKRLDLFYGKSNYLLEINNNDVFFEINLNLTLSFNTDKAIV